MARIVVLDDLSPEGLRQLERADGIDFEVHVGLKGADLRNCLAEFDGAICRSGVKIDAAALEGNTRLQAIVRAGVGTDNIDKAAATRHGIIVMNTPSGNTVSTAEHTMALLLGLARHTAAAYRSLQDGRWDRKSFSGTELRGKVLGIVGLGRIGQSVARKAAAFEMKVLGFDPFLSREKAHELGWEVTDTLDELLPQVDFLTVHTPLTPQTTHLVNRERLQLLKPGVRLVNCARGGIYDEEVLVEGLKSGRIGGVALDVYAEEPCTNSPLFGLPNTLCTPHLGASTEEAQLNVALEAVELLVNFFQTGEIRHAVNMASIDATARQRLRPPANLAYRLGRLLSQWHGGAIENCEIKLEGDIVDSDQRWLSSAACLGLLESQVHALNLVNAESLARERGINVVRSINASQSEFQSLIALKVSGNGKSLTASGTLFGAHQPRLVALNGFPLETPLSGSLLIFTHQDVPGIVGYVGQVLASEQVNIAQMAVGRLSREPGQQAIGVLCLDQPAGERAREKIASHPPISSVTPIELPSPEGWPDCL